MCHTPTRPQARSSLHKWPFVPSSPSTPAAQLRRQVLRKIITLDDRVAFFAVYCTPKGNAQLSL